MSNYIIGIDVGATKSHLLIFTAEGQKVDLKSWGPLNHEALPGSFAQLETELGEFILNALRDNNITLGQIKYGVFGMAGVDTRGQHEIISAIIRRIGIKEFILFNDGFLGIPAGSPSAVGICAINGTGESIFGLDAGNRTFQIGGVGYISSDMGGGGELGRRVVSAVYRELFRGGEATILTPMLMERLGITSKYEFIERIYEKIDDGSYHVGRLNSLLFEAAHKGDGVAGEVMKQIAWNYAGGIVCMTKELDFPSDQPLDIVLAGSVFVKGEYPVLRDMLADRVRVTLSGRELRFHVFDKPPVAGAVVWALKCLNGGGDYLEMVYNQL